MDPVELRFQLDRDKSWRWDELRELNNICMNLSSEPEKERFRRSIILMLYAHYEGFVKNAFLAYSTALNADALDCSTVNSAIVAASLAPLFSELRDPQARSQFFGVLPDDSKLHRFARDREFVERYPVFAALPVAIPDSIVDTESNLKPVVLRKLLFRFGFSPELFEECSPDIHRLLNLRNNIGHGESQESVREKEFDELVSAVESIVDTVTVKLTQAAVDQAYLRTA